MLTETWLREADFHVSPTKADYASICGLDVFRRFQTLNPEMGFAENLGVVVNMIDPNAETDRNYRTWLAENASNRCFNDAIPRLAQLQHAVHFRPEGRTYVAKYPGAAGHTMRALTAELLARLAAGQTVTNATMRSPVPTQSVRSAHTGAPQKGAPHIKAPPAAAAITAVIKPSSPKRH